MDEDEAGQQPTLLVRSKSRRRRDLLNKRGSGWSIHSLEKGIFQVHSGLES
jgi:hypothetical protein